MIKRTRIDDIKEETQDWLIEGVVCPWLTLLSGQPKHGKSIFAGHVAIALIQETQLLGRATSGTEHLIGWMGYDAGWRQELSSRWSEVADNRIIAFEPLRSHSITLWQELGQTLQREGVTLFVLDHLYGMAGALGLNDAEHFAVLANLLRPIYEEFGVAVLLLAQAGRSELNRGRAAHSVAIEGEARALIRIFEKRVKGARKIELSSNTTGEETLLVTLTPEGVEIREKKSSKKETVPDRQSPDVVRDFLANANPLELTSWSGAGRELHRLGFSKNALAGRQMSYRWREQGLIKKDLGAIVPGDSLLPATNLTNSYKDKNAS